MIKKIFPIVLLALFIAACSSNDDNVTTPNPNPDVSFDRAGMLRNYADNLIIPAYENLSVNLDALETAKDGFITAPNQPTLDNLRTAWFTAYKSWQRVEVYNIGCEWPLLHIFGLILSGRLDHARTHRTIIRRYICSG